MRGTKDHLRASLRAAGVGDVVIAEDIGCVTLIVERASDAQIAGTVAFENAPASVLVWATSGEDLVRQLHDVEHRLSRMLVQRDTSLRSAKNWRRAFFVAYATVFAAYAFRLWFGV